MISMKFADLLRISRFDQNLTFALMLRADGENGSNGAQKRGTGNRPGTMVPNRAAGTFAATVCDDRRKNHSQFS